MKLSEKFNESNEVQIFGKYYVLHLDYMKIGRSSREFTLINDNLILKMGYPIHNAAEKFGSTKMMNATPLVIMTL